MWNQNLGNLRVTLTPPGGAQPIVFEWRVAGATGTLTGGIPLPLTNSGVMGVGGSSSGFGGWRIQIASMNERNVEVPFNFMLLGDDAVLNTSFSVAPGEYAVGGKIKITARIGDFGGAITGLSNQTNARLQAAIVATRSNIGDVLSDSSLAPTSGGSPDAGMLRNASSTRFVRQSQRNDPQLRPDNAR